VRETIRIFVGCAANDEDLESQAVLEYTLRKYASLPIQITWMQQSHDPDSWFYVGKDGWNTSLWATPFSGFRWIIPYMAAAEGHDRAIYMDSDFIVLGDIADLWQVEFGPGRAVVARGDGRFCCSLWNVSEALGHLPAYPALRSEPTMHAHMTGRYAKHPEWTQKFPPGNHWNWLDYEAVLLSKLQERGIKAIHYTRIEMQLQIKHAKKRLAKLGQKHWYTGPAVNNDWPGLQALFDESLIEAEGAGFPPERYAVASHFGDYKIRR
jgi:hypothetical protein